MGHLSAIKWATVALDAYWEQWAKGATEILWANPFRSVVWP
jgi:hypothetical protein